MTNDELRTALELVEPTCTKDTETFKTEKEEKMKIEDFGPYTLSSGSHHGPEDGMCAMEMVSFLAGEKWSDSPICACPVISGFVQVGNDSMPDDVRQRLQTYVPRLIGTRSLKHEEKRLTIAVFAAVHDFAPRALDAAGFHDEARELYAVRYGDFYDADRAVRATACATARASSAYPVADSTYLTIDSAYLTANSAYRDSNYANLAADYASRTARFAADVAGIDVWNQWFSTLDAMIDAGPHGEAYSDDHLIRARDLKLALA